MKQELIDKAKKIVIKIGSSTVTTADGKVDVEFVTDLCNQVKALMDDGKQVVIVSSGARMTGVSSINKWSRKEDMTDDLGSRAPSHHRTGATPGRRTARRPQGQSGDACPGR